jgi:cytochrome P450
MQLRRTRGAGLRYSERVPGEPTHTVGEQPVIAIRARHDELGSGLRALLAGDPQLLADPFPLLAAVRQASRAYAVGPAVVLTHYSDVRWALRDTEELSNRVEDGSRIADARARLEGEARGAFDEVMAFESNFPSRNDGDDHLRLRNIANRLFTARRVAALEQAATRYIHAALDGQPPDEPVDAMRFAFRLPLLIVADLLGVPHEDVDRIHAWSGALGAANASTEPAPFMAAQAVLREFRVYVETMVRAQRMSARATDLLVTLMGAEEEGRLTEEELAALFVQILFAGHETTMNLIGTGLLSLLRHTDQWRLLCHDPELVRDAVEELMRYVSPALFVSRVARRAMEIDGTTIEPGQTVLLMLGAANRDPAVFADPDRLDVRRPDSKRQLGFGLGRHHCLGASLARLEAQVVFRELAVHHPDATLAGGSPQWAGGAMLRHLIELPVRLGARR